MQIIAWFTWRVLLVNGVKGM